MWQDHVTAISHVTSFAELHYALSTMSAGWEGIGRVFRGQSDVSWQLVPKAGRPPYSTTELPIYFAEWKLHALGLAARRLENDWEWLALAQHHGLATNLMDWTYNPLAAAFFAVADDKPCDAALFSYRPDSLALIADSNPLTVDGIVVYKPFHVAQRIARQMGVFTVHGPPTLALDAYGAEAEKLEVLIIDRAYRAQLLIDLVGYGVNHATLFPDLDGMSHHINWKMLHDIRPDTV